MRVAESEEVKRQLIEFVDLGPVGLFYTTISLIGRIEETLDGIGRVRRACTRRNNSATIWRCC